MNLPPRDALNDMRQRIALLPSAPETIADPAHRLQVVGMRRVRFQLLAQVPDVDIHDVVIIVGISPYTFQQLGARKHATGMLCEREQEANSRAVSSIGCPCSVTSCCASSIVRSSQCCGAGVSSSGSELVWCAASVWRGRRSSALIRATSSRGLKGLVR